MGVRKVFCRWFMSPHHNFCLHLPDYILVLSNLALWDMHWGCLHPEQKRRGTCVPELFLGCGELLVFRDFFCIPSSLIVHMCEAGARATWASRWTSSLSGWFRFFSCDSTPHSWTRATSWTCSALAITSLGTPSGCGRSWCAPRWDFTARSYSWGWSQSCKITSKQLQNLIQSTVLGLHVGRCPRWILWAEYIYQFLLANGAQVLQHPIHIKMRTPLSWLHYNGAGLSYWVSGGLLAGGRVALSITPYMNWAGYCRQRNYYSKFTLL
jgi:hypothetical protein